MKRTACRSPWGSWRWRSRSCSRERSPCGCRDEFRRSRGARARSLGRWCRLVRRGVGASRADPASRTVVGGHGAAGLGCRPARTHGALGRGLPRRRGARRAALGRRADRGGDAGLLARDGGELLRASSALADRVLVVFTDGEAHDTLPGIVAAAQRLQATGVRLILVAEGGRTPTRIPVRDDRGVLLGYQKDADGDVIETTRRDDVLGAAADAAQGTLVAADLPDQAGAVRDLVASYRRARASETRAERGRPRAWLPPMLAVMVLVAQAAAGRTAAVLGPVLAS